MPVISVEIKKTIDETESQKKKNKQTNKQTKKKQKKNKQKLKGANGREPIVKGWEINDFVLHLS